MPRVPTADNFAVAQSELPGVRQSVPSAAYRLADMAGRQEQQFGQASSTLGTELLNEKIDEQEMANQIRINDAKNQLLAEQNKLTYNDDQTKGDLGFQAYKSKNALAPDPDSGEPLDVRYAGKLKQRASDIAATLGNDAQKRQFAMFADSSLTSFGNQVRSHMMNESNAFTKETNTGTIQLAAETAALNYADPDLVAEQVKSAKAAAYLQSQHDGLPGAAQTMLIRDTESHIHRKVIEAALEAGNPAYAMKYKDEFAKSMNAADTLAVLGKINKQQDALVVQGLVHDALRTNAPSIQPTDMDRLDNITKLTGIVRHIESGGDMNAKNPKSTAKSDMQVIDGTNRDPGFGVKPAQNDSLEERSRVGRDYLGAMVKRYGDVGQALAAYTAGPGVVDKAIKEKGDQWFTVLPKDKQDYVRKGLSMFNTGQGAPAFPTKAEFINGIVGRLPTGSRPELVALAQQQAEHQFSVLEATRKEQGERAVQDAQQALIANGGDFGSLPPATLTAVTQYAPGKYDDLRNFAKAVNPANKVETNLDAYANATAYPGELAKMDDATFKHFLLTNFAEKDREKIANLRSDMITGKSNVSPQSLDYKTTDSVLTNRLLAFGIVPPDKKASDEEKQRWGTVYKYVTDELFNQQQQTNRKLTDQEITQRIDKMFAGNFYFRNTILGIPHGDTKSVPLMSMMVGDIPSTDLDAIKDTFAKRGISAPTNDMILRAYWKGKNAK